MDTLRGGAEAARRAHNPKVLGSNPSPATGKGTERCLFSFKVQVLEFGLGIQGF